MQLHDVRHIPFPLDVGLLGQDTQAGAWNVEEDFVRRRFLEGRGICAAEPHIPQAKALARSFDQPELCFVLIHRDHLPLVLHHLREVRGLPAGGGTEIDHPFTGFRSDQETGKGRAFILDGEHAVAEQIHLSDACQRFYIDEVIDMFRAGIGDTKLFQLAQEESRLNLQSVDPEGESGPFVSGNQKFRRFVDAEAGDPALDHPEGVRVVNSEVLDRIVFL